MRAKGEKNHRSVRQPLTKAVLTLPNLTTLLTDYKNNPKVPINAGATTATGIQPPGYNTQALSVIVRITYDLIELAI